MSQKMKATVPLALAVAVIAFVYVEFTANFTFHWVTNGSLGPGSGLSLPSNFHLVIPAGFISWGLFFALGADNAALRTVAINSLIGCLAGLVLFVFVHAVKGMPDFWAISLGVALIAFILIALSGGFPWISVPVIFCTFAAAVFWWIATGLDGWAPGGGGSLAALKPHVPPTAGSGAFGGVLSTPYGFVALNVAVTLLIGCLCGALSTRFAGLLTPKPREADAGVAEARATRASHS